MLIWMILPTISGSLACALMVRLRQDANYLNRKLERRVDSVRLARMGRA